MGRKQISFEEKVKIMYKYLEENADKTGIKARTKYGEYPIGRWQSSMRTAYYKGELEISEELETELLNQGILRKEKLRKSAPRMTWNQKYEIIKRYLQGQEDNVNNINQDTIFEGYPIGVWQRTLRHLFYTGQLSTISPELKRELLKKGILKKEKSKALQGGPKKNSYDKKFSIMYQYLESIDFEYGIKQSTKFKGKPIGVWQDNLRQTYRKGRDLEISPELMDSFFTYGILREEDIKIRNSRKSGKKATVGKTNKHVDSSENVEQMVEELLRMQEERNALDALIEELQYRIKAKTDNGLEI